MSLLDSLWRWLRTIRRQPAPRGSPRFPVRAGVLLILKNGVRLRGVLHDMSKGGAFMHTTERPFGLETGEEGSLRLAADLNDEDAGEYFHCRVMRISPEGVALRFSNTEKSSPDQLRAEDFYPEDFME